MKSQDKSKQIYQEHEILRSTKEDCEKFTETFLPSEEIHTNTLILIIKTIY